jgi:biopolymer transport protein ExbD
MPIKFRCPKCRQAYSIASKKAGTSLRCQKCDANMRIPAVEPKADEKSSPTNDQQELNSGGKVDLPEPMNVVRLSDIAGFELRKLGNDEDDLASVLEFEQSLKEDESAPVPTVPLPDELFAEDDDEDDDDNWGGGRAGDDEEMDLTPMVDVTFLLLVFFMITASFSIQKTLEVPPPNPDESGASQSQTIKDMEENSILVHIDSRDVISVDDEPLSDPTRLADIMRSKRMTEVLITAHENSLHDTLAKVIDASNETGMQKIRVGIVKGND